MGLLRGMVKTAAVAGTSQAVRGRVSRRQAERRPDVGVELRARRTLELKLRQSVGERLTVAFAAFGPTGSRHSAIINASQALFAGRWAPELGCLSSRSSNYPKWLAHVAPPRPTSPSPSHLQVSAATDQIVNACMSPAEPRSR